MMPLAAALPAPQKKLLQHVVTLFIFFTVLGCDPVELELQPTEALLDRELFEVEVFPVLIDPTNRCANSGCHNQAGGSGGKLRIFVDAEPGTTEMNSNYISAQAFANINDPPDSKILLKALQGNFGLKGKHSGGDIFLSTNDNGYKTILNWISSPASVN